ncbi:hypothetical protein KP509_30G052500 [Ceratopteris richardii]|uniref:Protein FRA10AC1 n=1 Tax=Ceratopteris richardii TaxID=49495 RepID=A0A8T2R2K2_CERRI|nr:hypothetical protein KP509_30G052500 [Ceratopteris richardii]
MGLNAYDRHKKFMNDYALHYGKVSVNIEERRPIKTDQDTLRETYRFIRTEEDDSDNTWEQRLAKRYYDKLFKEYCIADMSHYKDGKIGMRWRSEKEVISGKGQFIFGSKNCDVKEDLSSYERIFTDVAVLGGAAAGAISEEKSGDRRSGWHVEEVERHTLTDCTGALTSGRTENRGLSHHQTSKSRHF